MKKLLIAMMLLTSSQVFALELGEADSKDMYKALAHWGTRYFDKGDKEVRIQVSAVRCIQQTTDQGRIGCILTDDLHQIEKTRYDHAANRLATLLVRHAGSTCNDSGTCATGARLIRCWHPWNDKNDPPVLVPRRFICDLVPIRD